MYHSSGKADNREICTHVEAGGIWEISVYHLNFNLKLLFKKCLKKKKRCVCLHSLCVSNYLNQNFVCPTYSDLRIHHSNLRKPKIGRVTSKVGAIDTLKRKVHTHSLLQCIWRDQGRIIAER